MRASLGLSRCALCGLLAFSRAFRRRLRTVLRCILSLKKSLFLSHKIKGMNLHDICENATYPWVSTVRLAEVAAGRNRSRRCKTNKYRSCWSCITGPTRSKKVTHSSSLLVTSHEQGPCWMVESNGHYLFDFLPNMQRYVSQYSKK